LRVKQAKHIIWPLSCDTTGSLPLLFRDSGRYYSRENKKYTAQDGAHTR